MLTAKLNPNKKGNNQENCLGLLVGGRGDGWGDPAGLTFDDIDDSIDIRDTSLGGNLKGTGELSGYRKLVWALSHSAKDLGSSKLSE